MMLQAASLLAIGKDLATLDRAGLEAARNRLLRVAGSRGLTLGEHQVKIEIECRLEPGKEAE